MCNFTCEVRNLGRTRSNSTVDYAAGRYRVLVLIRDPTLPTLNTTALVNRSFSLSGKSKLVLHEFC